jgi:hypothetical protein
MLQSSSCNANEPRRSKQIAIAVYSMVSLVDPAVSLLEPYLEYRLMRFDAGGPLGYQSHSESVAICGSDFRGRMAVPTGLVPRIARVLAENGYAVKVTDHRVFGARFAIDKEFLALLKGEDRRFVDAVRHEPLGQTEVRNFRDLIASMQLIISLYPNSRFLVAVATKALARKICHNLNATTADEYFAAWLYDGVWPDETPRCMVGTIAALETCRTQECDIILLPDPGGAVGAKAVSALSRFHGPVEQENHRVYSFLMHDLRLGRRGRLRLEAVSGRMIYHVAAERVGVRVIWLSTPGCKTVDQGCSALAFKREAYWRNGRRNDYIAAVARAFAKQDTEKLINYGVSFTGGKPMLRHAPHASICVIVAGTDQARELSKRLPGWEVLDAVPNKQTDNRWLPDEETMPPGTIVTEAKAGKDGIFADVVIRAGGGTGTLCFKEFPAMVTVSERDDALLVDFTDGFDDRAVQHAQRRRKEYDLRGWDNETDCAP